MGENLKNTIKTCILNNLWFKILSSVSIILLIIAFFVPPTAQIDPSVIAASGEIMGWGAMWTVVLAIEKGKQIEMKHGNTEIHVRKNGEEK